jgi:hypothetical protein
MCVSVQITYCTTSDAMAVNLRADLSVTLLNNLLCVSAVNNAVTGDFLNGVTALSQAAVTAALAGANPFYTFGKNYLTSALSTATAYNALDNVGALAYFPLQSSWVATSARGYLSIPMAGFNKECNDQNYARFLQPQNTNPGCLRCVVSKEEVS